MLKRREKRADLYRMVMPEHVCPYGLKAKWLLEQEGYTVTDHWLKSRAETDAFKHEHKVETTPQTFIGDLRVGGYDNLRRYFDRSVAEPDETSYRPVAFLFGMTALMALMLAPLLAAPAPSDTLRLFIGLSMGVLALLKLRDIESFSTMMLNYDLLARRWVPYGYIYPYAEGAAGLLMLGGALPLVSAPIALFIGGVGAASVIKAVYIDKRELRCACMGGDSQVPLGFISLTENLMMIAGGLMMLIL